MQNIVIFGGLGQKPYLCARNRAEHDWPGSGSGKARAT